MSYQWVSYQSDYQRVAHAIPATARLLQPRVPDYPSTIAACGRFLDLWCWRDEPNGPGVVHPDTERARCEGCAEVVLREAALR